jgi:hypothetical protein
MALIEEAGSERDIGQRQISKSQHLLRLLDTPLRDIRMGGNTDCPFEFAGEMVDRQTGHRSQIRELDPLGQVLCNVQADPPENPWRKSAADGWARLGDCSDLQQVEPWMCMENKTRPGIARRCYQCGSDFASADSRKVHKKVIAMPHSETLAIPLEYTPHTSAVLKHLIVQTQHNPRGPIGSENALVIVNRQ